MTLSARPVALSALVLTLVSTAFVPPAQAAPEVVYLGQKEKHTVLSDGSCDIKRTEDRRAYAVLRCEATNDSQPRGRAPEPTSTLTAGETIRIQAGTHPERPCKVETGKWQIKVKFVAKDGSYATVTCGKRVG